MYHKAFGLRAVALADHIITISESSRRDLITCGIPDEKLTVIYPGVNPLYFTKPLISQIGIEMKFGFICPYVLYVGGFNPRKNIERLIITFMGAKEKYKFNYRLVLAGGYGWDNSLVYDLAKRFHKDITIIQNPSNDELHALYSYASLFVYPSLYEGFGLPIAEAMACGCPVLCSDRSSMPEVIGDWDLTFNPVQIPYEIFSDIENVPRSTNQFTWDRAAKQTLEVYESCCDRAV
jgi:glycosyltransferase involved in cell wall biosynthesis